MPGPTRMRGTAQKPRNVKKAISFVWSYAKKYKLYFIFALIMVFVNIIFSLSATNALQPIIDNFLENTDISNSARIAGLVKGCVTLGIYYLCSTLASYLQTKLMLNLSQKTINEIRGDLFNHLQDLSVKYYDTHENGELMSRFTNDVDTLNDALQNSLTSIISSVVTLISTIGLMFSKSVPLTLVMICLTPITVFAAQRIMKKSGKYYMQQQKCLGAVNGYVEEIMTGEKVVKVFCYEQRATEHFKKLNNDLRDSATTAQTYGGMMMPVVRNINSTIYALIALFGGIIAITSGQSSLTIGGLIVFLNLAQQFGRPINEASNQFNAIITAISGAERINDVMDQKPEILKADNGYMLEKTGNDFFWRKGDEKISLRGDVKFENVTFGYNADKTILHEISLFARPGEKIAFVGSTGAGKTTILNLISRFYDIENGTITVDGIPIKEIDRDSLRRSMAVVLQDTHLFTGTVRENIRYGRLDATDSEIEDAAKLASAHSFIMRLPQGYDTIIKGDGANLSQGQRQLLNIARAAVANAPILVLDEATSSVDTRTEKHIEHGLDRLMKDRTTFVIAHRLSTVRNSNAIMVMEQGQIIERGTHDDLLKEKGRYYQLYTGVAELD